VSGAASCRHAAGADVRLSLDRAADSYSIYAEAGPLRMSISWPSHSLPRLLETYKWVTKRTRNTTRSSEKLRQAGSIPTTRDETGFSCFTCAAPEVLHRFGCCDLIIDNKIRLLQAADSDRFVATVCRMKDARLSGGSRGACTGFEGCRKRADARR